MSGKAHLPFGLKGEKLKPGAMKTISDTKLATFVVGQQKKSRFQKQKEAAEEKKKQEMAEAANIYEQFVASFETDTDSKTFVRGGSETAGRRDRERDRGGRGGFSSGQPGSEYKLDSRSRRGGSPPRERERRSGSNFSSGPPKKQMTEMERLLEEMKESKEGGSGSGRNRSSSGSTSNFSSGPPSVEKNGSKKPKRAIDDFLEEIKNKQETGGASTEDVGEAMGSFDDGDPETTNLYVGNLAPTTTEETLNEIFGKFGQIYSVKIMWPRTDEERLRARNCGFVSFMQRADAAEAKNELHDMEIDGYRMTIGWGKAIKKLTGNATANLGVQGGYLKPNNAALPPGLMPAEIQSKLESAIQSANSAAEKKESATDGVGGDKKTSKFSDTPPVVPTEREMTDADEKVVVKMPADRYQCELLDRLARYVSKDGQALETIIRDREASNPEYVCLREPNSEEGLYYRWKVFSLLMGDRERRWREKPFQMSVGGPFWVPPPMPKEDSDSDDDSAWREREKVRQKERERLRAERYQYATGAQLEKAREKDRAKASSKGGGRSTLSDAEYDDFSDALRSLTESRQLIKMAMGKALDFADASEEVVELLCESLLVDATPISVKIARLYLLSDILHNSSAPVRNASSYRMHIQKSLPKIFEHLNKTYRSVGGRFTAKAMEDKVMKLLHVWMDWSLYPPTFISGLEATFQRKTADLEVELPGVIVNQLDLEDLRRKARLVGIYYDGGKDSALSLLKKLFHMNEYVKVTTATATPGGMVRGPLDGSVNFGSLGSMGGGGVDVIAALTAAAGDEDIDGAPIDDVDGAPMDGEDLDGAPMDGEDLDGAPMDGEDLDGAPMDGEDLDGAPMDGEDWGGAPMNFPAPPPNGAAHGKRKRDDGASLLGGDYGSGSSDEDEGPGKIDLDEPSSNPTGGLTSHHTEEDPARRELMRKVETEVMLLRDELEAKGTDATTIEEACAARRTVLLKPENLIESEISERERQGGARKRSRSRSPRAAKSRWD